MRLAGRHALVTGGSKGIASAIVEALVEEGAPCFDLHLSFLDRGGAHASGACDLGYAPDGGCIATSSFDATVRSFDAGTAQPLRVLRGHTREVSALGWCPQSGHLLT